VSEGWMDDRIDKAQPLAAAFTATEVETRGRDKLSLELPQDAFTRVLPRRGDHNLNRERFSYDGLGKPAAVLVPVVAHPQGATMLLTQRTSKLRAHAGQVAFPGGRMDPEDATPIDTALREAYEEVGLQPADASPVGYLDPYQTGTGYRIIPVVAIIKPDLVYTLNPDEVDAAFEVPLAFLMEPGNRHLHHREFEGIMRSFYAIPFGDHYIWGATAGILYNFYERLYA